MHGITSSIVPTHACEVISLKPSAGLTLTRAASYGGSIDAFFARGAVYVDKILRGEAPSGMPMEQPTEFDLAVNLKVAKELGVKIPQSVLLRATRVIE